MVSSASRWKMRGRRGVIALATAGFGHRILRVWPRRLMGILFDDLLDVLRTFVPVVLWAMALLPLAAAWHTRALSPSACCVSLGRLAPWPPDLSGKHFAKQGIGPLLVLFVNRPLRQTAGGVGPVAALRIFLVQTLEKRSGVVWGLPISCIAHAHS